MIRMPSDLMEPIPRPWSLLPGDFIELRRVNTNPRQGYIDTVMPDGRGFWIRQEGVEHREFIGMDDETIVVCR